MTVIFNSNYEKGLLFIPFVIVLDKTNIKANPDWKKLIITVNSGSPSFLSKLFIDEHASSFDSFFFAKRNS